MPSEKDELYEGMCASAVGEIRDLLTAQGIPPAAFVEDHVRNALVQRRRAIDALSRIATSALDHREAMRIARETLDNIDT